MRYRSCVVASLLFLASVVSEVSAQQMPEHVRSALDKLVGEWTMETIVDSKKTQSEIVVEWAVKDTTLMFKWHGTDFVTGKEEASTGILGWNPIKKLVVEYEIGSGGFASQATHHITKDGNWISPIRGSTFLDGKAVFFESHRTIRFVSKDEWIVTGVDRVIDGEPQSGDKSTFRRKNSAPTKTAKATAPVHVKNSIGMEFRWIPASEFMMGTVNKEGDTQCKVTISRPYYMGVYEVTQANYKRIMGSEPWKGRRYVREGDNYPAVYVSWEKAQEFIKKLNGLTVERNAGRTYHLPTEAEWEFACLAGKQTAYSFGNDTGQLVDYAWFNLNAKHIGETYAHSVGGKAPNEFGLYDMHGNVFEWCQNWYGAYPSSPVTDPTGPSSGTERTYRGGGWHDNDVNCRAAKRHATDPRLLSSGHGFRVALTQSSEPSE